MRLKSSVSKAADSIEKIKESSSVKESQDISPRALQQKGNEDKSTVYD